MRPVKIYTIVIVLLILLHIIRINNTNKYIPKQAVTIDDFILRQYAPTCWYVFQQQLFKLDQCRQYALGSRLTLVGTVSANTDNLPSGLDLVAVTGVNVTFNPSEYPWYHPNIIQSKIFQIRESLQQKLQLVLPKTEAGLLFSVIFGGIAFLPEEMKDTISYLGIQHIMAASGMQVTLLLLVFNPLLKQTSGKVTWLIQTCLLAFYAQLALMSVSILRAVLQSLLSAFLITSQLQQTASWLMLISLLILVSTIDIDGQLALQLSFLAVIGLQFRSIAERTLFGEPIRRQAKKTWYLEIQKYIKEVLITSVYVQIWLFPLLCHYFGQVSSLSVIATLGVVWLLTPLFLLGVPTIVVLALMPIQLLQSPMVLIFCWPLHNLLWLLTQIIYWLEKITLPPIGLAFSTPLLVGWYVCLLIALWWFDARWLAVQHRGDLKIIRKKY